MSIYYGEKQHQMPSHCSTIETHPKVSSIVQAFSTPCDSIVTELEGDPLTLETHRLL